jgi:hypothetical protein
LHASVSALGCELLAWLLGVLSLLVDVSTFAEVQDDLVELALLEPAIREKDTLEVFGHAETGLVAADEVDTAEDV